MFYLKNMRINASYYGYQIFLNFYQVNALYIELQNSACKSMHTYTYTHRYMYCSKQLRHIMNLIGNNHAVENACNKNERKEVRKENFNVYIVLNMQILS